MHAEVERLVRQERMQEAAAKALELGDPKTASDLYERACDFTLASAAAIRSGDGARALLLAVTGGDDEAAARALDFARADASGCSEAAARLLSRGDFAWAARAFEATGDFPSAAIAWERSGDAARAAELLEKAGDPVAAAKVLEAAMRRQPDRAALPFALGALLARHGRHEACVRALQSIDALAPERREALPLLVRELRALGMDEAAMETSRELGPDASPEPSPIAAPLQAKRLIFGRYELVREVASTASARVVECIDTVRCERVALKILSAFEARGGGRDALARFEREAKVLGTLDHPNVVPLRDYIAEGPAIAVAWMPGGTLEQMMTAPIAPARAVEIADAVLGALGEAHRLGVLHRDVKPANVLFDEAGVARLADFGVAHLGDLSVTATAGVIGTLSYMSPEQREGRPATVKSDLYGVGVMLFEMLTAQRVRVDEPPLVMPSAAHRELSGQHDALVMRLLARDPSGRPADAFEARRALGSATWPNVPGPVVPAPRAGQHAPGAASPARVTLDASGAAIDSRTGQRVERVALDAPTLARAGAFARARCRALQLVLRVDREGGSIWLEARRSASEAFALSPAERGALRAALLALHAEGCVHGRVDRAHIDRFAGEVTLAFCASPDAGAATERDLAQLAEL